MGGGNGTEAKKRLHRCCFTGHRPEKLNCTEKEAVALLTDQIRKAYSLGYTTFISGMAKGIDETFRPLKSSSLKSKSTSIFV